MIDILVISHACTVGLNRSPYRYLKAAGWQLELLIPEHLTCAAGIITRDPQADDDPPIHLLPLSSDKPRSYSFKGLITLLNHRQPRLILLDNDPSSRLSLQIGHWCKRHHSVLVCQSCDNLSRRFLASFQRSGLRGLINACFLGMVSLYARSQVKHVLVLSRDSEIVFEEQGYKGRITRIPLGFDKHLFHADNSKRKQIRQQLGLNQITIAYFGRLSEEKGMDKLIQALSQLKSTAWQLLIDEFKDYSSDYQLQINHLLEQQGLMSKTVFFDATHDEMADYMNAADIVVVPSIATLQWKEQYGRVVPEAMACGKTVIVSDSGTLPDLIGDAGIVVPSGNIQALVVALDKIIQDQELRHHLGQKAVTRSNKYFSLDSQVEILNSVIKEALPPPEQQ